MSQSFILFLYVVVVAAAAAVCFSSSSFGSAVIVCKNALPVPTFIICYYQNDSVNQQWLLLILSLLS